MNFGEKVRSLRKEKGLTTVALSKETGISQPTISVIENGKQYPKEETMEKIANVLEFDYAPFLEKEEQIENTSDDVMDKKEKKNQHKKSEKETSINIELYPGFETEIRLKTKVIDASDRVRKSKEDLIQYFAEQAFKELIDEQKHWLLIHIRKQFMDQIHEMDAFMNEARKDNKEDKEKV